MATKTKKAVTPRSRDEWEIRRSRAAAEREELRLRLEKRRAVKSEGVALGEFYEDRVTYAKGVATARTVYFHGAPRVLLESLVAGRVAQWFDEARLRPVEDQ